MTPSRRQFVAGTLAGVPVFLLAPSSVGQRPRPVPPADPVWIQIGRELARVYEELRSGPLRADSLRAFESALRMHAAHASATGFDAALKKSLSARLDAVGRSRIVDELTRGADGHRRHDEVRKHFPRYVPDERIPRVVISAEDADRVLTGVAAGGASPLLLAAADEIGRKVEELVARQPQPASFRRVQHDQCWAMQQALRALEALTGLVCSLVILQPELAPACAISAFELAGLQLAYWWMCEGFI
jgi:hypothetical protein